MGVHVRSKCGGMELYMEVIGGGKYGLCTVNVMGLNNG